jgi:hypothetical protein
MGSGRWRVGRLQGGSCSNDNSSSVVALAVTRLGGGLREERLPVCAGDGGRWTTRQQGAVDDAGQAGGQGTIWQDVGTLKDGYICNVPLPRVPQEQSARPTSIAPPPGIPLPGYLQLPS